MTEQPNEYLIQKLRDALASDPRIGELGTTIRIVDHDVFVQGVVATEARRQAIGEVLATMLPDWTIHNAVDVEKMHDPDTVEDIA